ncbi:MAG TPA: lipid-binding SYLF domain-containing protein [Blastocatellia bacterium]|nr:lipid-binding SYLF domain-containing protein [Blastocatellia bacterium]
MKTAPVLCLTVCLLGVFEAAAQRRLPNGQPIPRATPRPIPANITARQGNTNTAAPAPAPTAAPAGTPGKADSSQITVALDPANNMEGKIEFKTEVKPEVKRPPTPSCKTLPDAHDWLERADRAATVLRESLDAMDRTMPQGMMNRSNCVAVVPSMKKGGISIGGQWGRGVMSCRYDNRAWSPPVFFTVTGGSFGLQLGFQLTDLIMIIADRSGADALLRDKVELGAGLGGSALLFGRNAGISSNVLMDSRVFSYARSRGLYGGLELRGAYFRPDAEAHRRIYGENSHVHDILSSERIPGELNALCYGGITSFSRALRDISPAKLFYARVPRSRYPQSTPPSAPAR